MRACSASRSSVLAGRTLRRRPLAALFLASVAFACGRAEPPSATAIRPERPIVVFNFGVLRADLIGALGGESGLTPEIDRFAQEATWAGRAIAASSVPPTALASQIIGVDPWQHGILNHLEARQQPLLPTLAEALAEVGYATQLVAPWNQRLDLYHFHRGFKTIVEPDDVALGRELAALVGNSFIWIQLSEADLPYSDRRAEIPALDRLPNPGRAHLDLLDMWPYIDPARPLPADLATDAHLLHRHEVAAGDARLGRFLAAMRGSEAWSRAIVVVTAMVGTALGERREWIYAQSLARETIEVPLLIKWPAGLPLPAEEPTRPVAANRLWATLVEAVGGRAWPIHAPSLFHRSQAPALSALYLRNGENLFSAVSAGTESVQLIEHHAFAPAEAAFTDALLAEVGVAGVTLSESPHEFFGRLQRSFAQAPPLAPRYHQAELWLWPRKSGALRLEDAPRREALGQALHRSFRRFVDADRDLSAEIERWRRDQELTPAG